MFSVIGKKPFNGVAESRRRLAVIGGNLRSACAPVRNRSEGDSPCVGGGAGLRYGQRDDALCASSRVGP